MLTPLRDVLVEAGEAGRAVAAFNVIHLEHAEALTGAAEQVGLPVVLQISENTVTFHGSLAPLAAATRVLAERASVPVVTQAFDDREQAGVAPSYKGGCADLEGSG